MPLSQVKTPGVLSSVLSAGLAGCSGGGSETGIVPPEDAGTAFYIGEYPTLSYDPESQTYHLATANGSAELNFDANRSRDGKVPIFGLNGKENGKQGANYTAFGLITQSGDGFAILAGNYDNGPAGDTPGYFTAVIERTLPDALPGSGTATATGSYVGVLSSSDITYASNGLSATVYDAPMAVYGIVTVTSDFSDGSVSGRISNRERIDQSSNKVLGTEPDLILQASDIQPEAGYFGSITKAGSSGGTGRYNGFYSGPNGSEVVGFVTHTNQGDPSGLNFEAGIYAASK